MRPGTLFNHYAGQHPGCPDWQARMLLAEEVALKLGITATQVRALWRAGRLEAHEEDGVLYFSPVQVERYLHRRR